MITDDQVRRLYQSGQQGLARLPPSDAPLPSQFYRGMGPHSWPGQPPGGCERHMEIFNRCNIIPRYCFGCYKVYIQPRSVIELLKLMMLFHALQLADDNTRKCIIELREGVPGAYKGFVYCNGETAGRRMLAFMREVIAREISPRTPVILKRGCTEYALAWPDYSPQGPQPAFDMCYPPEWQAIEDQAELECGAVGGNSIRSHNQSAFTPQEARIMRGWLCYAAMIGDTSYLKISGHPLPTSTNITRPHDFVPEKD